ncbi:MAG TPA: NACHT domain-containing protein, partial [Anaerolineae bacterium]
MADDRTDRTAELRRKLANLQSLRDVLGADAFEKAQTELEAQLAVLTEGGAVVLGAVDTGGGKFVGRDDLSTTINASADAPPEELLEAYYRALANECRRLPLGVIDVEFVRTSGEQPVPLPDVYVDLDVVTPAGQPQKDDERAWALRLMRGEGENRASLLDAITQPGASHTVLLGNAGSGKSTFVNYLTYLLCANSQVAPEAFRGMLPVRLILREVVARHIPADTPKGTAQMLWDALRDDVTERLGEDVAVKLLPHLKARLLKEGAFVLLDGLDEVPEAQQRRKALLQAVQDLSGTLPAKRSHVLVTARPYAYADRQWQLSKFATLALAPFSEEQVKRFIECWYQAVRPSMGWNEDTARDKGNRLRSALRERPYLGDLASRPLLLTLMATLHSSWGQLPEDRADLYGETVKLLLSRWQRAREVKAPGGEIVVEPGIAQALGVGESRIRAALESLAFRVHQRQRTEAGRDDAPADISEGEVLIAFKPLLGSVKPDDLLGYLRDRAGLLVTHRESVYAFPHRSFQEYLAACYQASLPQCAENMCRLVQEDPAWWREVYLLAAGKLKQGGLGNVVNLLNVLLPAGPDETIRVTEQHWRAANLVGQALLEVQLPEKAAGQPHYEAILKRAQRWLVKLVEEGHLPAPERAEAGDVLGQLGDPRFDPNVFFLPKHYRGEPEPFHGFMEIPAGPFVMGSRKGDKDTFDDEYGNPDELTIPYAYWLARYPVTVAQFGAFVAAQGYANDVWWTKTGWAWRIGEWDSQVQEGWLRDYLKSRPRKLRGAPMWWDEQRSYPNRPVSGVSWFESM